MKSQIVIVALTCLTFSSLIAQEVKPADLPDAVHRTLGDVKGADLVKEIKKEVRDGKTVYEVEFDRRGLNPKIWIAEDGSIVRDTRRGTTANPTTGRKVEDYVPPLSRFRSLEVRDVPEPVQQTIREQAAGREVADIDRETWDGKVVYEVEFAQTGRNAQIHVTEDGVMVRDNRVGTGLPGIFLGTQLEDTPASVQETIKREAGNRQIVDIDKERRTGSIVYEVEFRDVGRNVELHIAENGTIVQDSRKAEGVGSPDAQSQTGIGSASREVKMSDLPASVQDDIKASTDPSTVKRILQMRQNGRTSYEVEFEQNGQMRKLRITADGKVLRDR
jgi:uncharacterized membrane protein YkoI